jgi:hypothetical protein
LTSCTGGTSVQRTMIIGPRTSPRRMPEPRPDLPWARQPDETEAEYVRRLSGAAEVAVGRNGTSTQPERGSRVGRVAAMQDQPVDGAK